MYREQKRSWIKHLDFTILDVVAQMLAMVIAYFWRFHGWILENQLYQRMVFWVIMIDIVVVFFTESYTGILRRNKYQELRSVVTHCFIVFAAFLIYLTATKLSYWYSRQMEYMYFLLAIVIEYILRVVNKRIVRRRMLLDKNKSEMLVVAESTNVEHCLHEIAHNKYTEFHVCGVVIVDEDRKGQEVQGIPVVANADDFLEYVRTNVIDEVYIDGNTKHSSETLASELVELGLTVHISLIHTDQMVPNRRLENYGDYIVMTTSMKIANSRQMFVKRLVDIIGALVGLLITGILFVIFAPVIYIQSPGPIFFEQTRIGRGGRRFKFYKFRSMYPDAEERKKALMEQNEMQGNMFKMENDPRIIPIGRFMRKYSLDEFPQFWNVLKGDMSLVGTRPPTEDEYENYALHHKARLAIKPGLTGMWQISGRSDITDFEDVVALDTQYIANWTLGLDLQILLKTVGVVFTGKGSK